MLDRIVAEPRRYRRLRPVGELHDRSAMWDAPEKAFQVGDAAGYRELRQQLTGTNGINAITRQGAMPLVALREVRADQYGIRTQVQMDGQAIKFEIVREARIELEAPGPQDVLCGVNTLTPLDLAASKLLANSDRQAADGVFSRDVIDLAKAIDRMQNRPGWLERCMQAMAMEMPKALLWQKIRALRRAVPSAA